MPGVMAQDVAENQAWFQPLVATAWRRFVNAVTPAHCLACAEPVEETACLCAACWSKLHLLEEPVCHVMGTPFAYEPGEGVLSAQALSHPPPWQSARAAVVFDDLSREIIHAFKYADRMEAGLLMARLMARAGRRLVAQADVIVPVPLHWTRLWKRRFNQAAFLAQYLARTANKKFDPALLKRRKATSQVGLHARERHKNMRRAFATRPGLSLAGKSVLLVDDVRTTGATTAACVEALQKAGAASVHVLTFALVNEGFRPHI